MIENDGDPSSVQHKLSSEAHRPVSITELDRIEGLSGDLENGLVGVIDGIELAAELEAIRAKPDSDHVTGKAKLATSAVGLKTDELVLDRAGHIAKYRIREHAQKQARIIKAAEAREALIASAGGAKPSRQRIRAFRPDQTLEIEIPAWVNEHFSESAFAHEVEKGPNETLAPGCFGMPMLYSPIAEECIDCPFRERCKKIAASNIKTLSSERAVDIEYRSAFGEYQTLKRTRNCSTKAKSRAKSKALKSPTPSPVARFSLTKIAIDNRKALLSDWLTINGPRQRQYRKYEKEIWGDCIIFQAEYLRLGAFPGVTAFAQALTKHKKGRVTVASAQKRLARLVRLESEGGPWFGIYLL